MKTTTSAQQKKKVAKRLRVVEAFLHMFSLGDKGKMNTCKCGRPLHKITVATIPGSLDTKFVDIEVCDAWLEQYHDEIAEQEHTADKAKVASDKH